MQAPDINILNALHSDVVKISSSSYELSIFSSKAGSGRGASGSVIPWESSSVSIGDLWLEINNVKGPGGEGAFMTATSDHLEASALRLVSGTGKTARGKTVMDSRGARKGSEVHRAPPSRSRKVASSSVVSKEEPAQLRATTTRCGVWNGRIQAGEGQIKAVQCPWS
jgi:hypothetical protein